MKATAALMLLLATCGARAGGEDALVYIASLNLDDLLKVEVNATQTIYEILRDVYAKATWMF